MFEYNILLSRFLNNVETLEHVGFQYSHQPDVLLEKLEQLANHGIKVWGNAYVITTHGIPMPKATYLCRNVLSDASIVCQNRRNSLRGVSCHLAAEALEGIEGVGSFLSAQIVADLKNTPGHPLSISIDKDNFVQCGPGSLRGASWFHYNEIGKVTPSNFDAHFNAIRKWVNENWPDNVPKIDNQDLQNALCEFDKFMRVKNGTGRSKRSYDGS